MVMRFQFVRSPKGHALRPRCPDVGCLYQAIESFEDTDSDATLEPIEDALPVTFDSLRRSYSLTLLSFANSSGPRSRKDLFPEHLQ
jgi:hypothetical protein